ncbi:MAG: acyl-CoA dehydrogenase [Actinobacteria bacterium ATB1]|nr:acyl-CoA dehydrogenase [Actinobacteria bacterium ATB1]
MSEMRFRFSDEQLTFRDAARDLLAKECPPSVVRAVWDGDTAGEDAVWAALCEMGVVGLRASEKHGGLALSDLDLVLLLREAGRVALPYPVVETAAVAVPLLDEIGGSLAAEWIPRIASGETHVAVGLPGERFVPAATKADLFLLVAGDAIHAVPRGDLTIRPQVSVDRSRRLGLVDWAPSPATRVAEGATATGLTELSRLRAALGTAAFLLGLGRHLLDITVGYACERHQFGVPIGSQQAVKHKLADVAVALTFAEPVVYRAAYSLAHGPGLADEVVGEGVDVHVSMAKAMASDAAMLAAEHALQCHGAIGYSYEYDLQLWMKRVWCLAAAHGDARTHRSVVERAVLG